MKQKDHLILARYLLERNPEAFRGEIWKRAFLWGNFIPDYLFFTYLRGFRKSGRMIGHNLPYSESRMHRLTNRLLATGLRSARDCFRLGLLMHYLADSFTFPHTEHFNGSRRDHNRYEKDLCTVFPTVLAQTRNPSSTPSLTLGPRDLIRAERKIYRKESPSVRTDALWIIRVCEKVFDAICAVKR